MNNIISWNHNSILSKYPFVQLLLKETNPSIFCAQETKLLPSHTFFLKKYNIYRQDFMDLGNARGGVLIAVSQGLYAEHITLTSPLQTVAVRVWLSTPITVCSIYLHHQDAVTLDSLQNLCQQLPAPFILTGDFNAHSGLWGSSHTDARGAVLEAFLAAPNITLLNSGQPTRFDMYSGSFTAIDLTLCSPTLTPQLTWSVLESSYSSDHLPQCIEFQSNPTTASFSPTWKFQEADWEAFSQLVDFSGITSCISATEMVSLIEERILLAATQSIPITTPPKGRYRVPWWDISCNTAVKHKRKTWRIYKRHPTDENLTNFKIARAKARCTLYEAKRMHWRHFISTINSSTPPSALWKRIRAITNKRSFEPIPAIRRTDGTIIGAECEIAEQFADFYRVSTHADADPEIRIDIPIDSSETEINQPIQIAEVIEATKRLKNTAAGPDRIHASMVKHLRFQHLQQLTAFFNYIWSHRDFPSQWKVAHIIPLYKPGKDRTSPSSYRPISLTNVLCKLFEKIIVKRMHKMLAQSNSLDKFQCGFRPNRSTTDSLVYLSQEILTGFAQKQHTVCVFFDVEKAFDRIHTGSVLQL